LCSRLPNSGWLKGLGNLPETSTVGMGNYPHESSKKADGGAH
jgi:hypothetical protein